jgi:hypothetical protein
MADLRDEIARLTEASAHELRIEWRRHYRSEPPVRLSRDLLLRGVAYKLQEHAEGGLSQMAKRTLRRWAARLDEDGPPPVAPATALTPGARLVRAWRGRSYAVTVLEDGFEYDGERCRSLSQIAKLITGVHWSGPRFFGLTKDREKIASVAATDAVSREIDDGEG